jgi:hypothetical protein
MFASLQGFSNAAQPGIFDAGGTGNFILIYPGDSNAFRKIQMVDEHIAIQLYRGFAVVRGEYKMYNTADSILTIKVGYPVNSMLRASAQGSTATDIFFDQLYALKSYTNGRENSLIIQEGAPHMSLEDNNWYIWESSFKPHDTTTLVVYFVVNTNNTVIREGYTIDKNNGFVYLLETGATWKQPIVRGEIKIALMDNLKISDIKGASPCCVLRVNEMNNTMLYRFADLSPVAEDNIVIVYTPNMEKFDFGYISQKRQLLFGSIDSFAKQSFDEAGLVQHSFPNPYKVHTVSVKNVAGVFVILGITILALIIILLLLRFLFRRIRDGRPSRGTEI